MSLTQVAISFDTTGSMSSALAEVRKRISEMIRRLKKDIPGVTLSVIAHGDYCDTDTYVTKHLDFSDDEDKLVDFVNDVESTGGGDAPECYELVLRLVRTRLSWKRKAQKILIVIGDSYPHPPTDPQNKDHIDWREEAKLLAEMPMRIYGVQIHSDPQSTEFFRTITQMSGGCHLELSEFSTLSDVILAICYRSKGTESLRGLEREVRARYAPKPLHKDLEAVFTALQQPHAVPTVPAKVKVSTQLYKGKHTAFFWGGEVTASRALSWKEPEEDNAVHSLRVKLALLDPHAEKIEANVVEVETTDINGQRLKQPLLKMVGGRDSTISVDVSFNSSVTFSLARGSGPVYLSGQHVSDALTDEEEEDDGELLIEASADEEIGATGDEVHTTRSADLEDRVYVRDELHIAPPSLFRRIESSTPRRTSDTSSLDDIIERRLGAFEPSFRVHGTRRRASEGATTFRGAIREQQECTVS